MTGNQAGVLHALVDVMRDTLDRLDATVEARTEPVEHGRGEAPDQRTTSSRHPEKRRLHLVP